MPQMAATGAKLFVRESGVSVAEIAVVYYSVEPELYLRTTQ
jgi:hypothetical protein